MAASGQPVFFKAKSLAYQSVPAIKKIVGPVITLKHVPGIYFRRAHFNKVFVDGADGGMKVIVIRPEILVSWKKAAADFGINATHAHARFLGDPPSAIPLIRMSAEITGAKGLPINPRTHAPWRLFYHEVAVVNDAKKASLTSSIRNSSGSERIALIKQCYDWFSELELRAN